MDYGTSSSYHVRPSSAFILFLHFPMRLLLDFIFRYSYVMHAFLGGGGEMHGSLV